MKVITKNPIIYGDDTTYSAIDASSSKDEILALQKLMNSKGEKLVDETGVFDAKTNEIYNKYKTRLDRELSEMGIEPIKLKLKPIQSSTSNDSYVPSFVQPNVNWKKTSWWSKRTRTQKGLIIGGAVILASVIGFVIYRQGKK
jgi:hypothetical protein